MEESDSSREKPSITFLLMINRATHVNKEKRKVSLVNSSSSAEPGYSRKPQNEDLINDHLDK